MPALKRLFIALWPDAPTGMKLLQLQKGLEGRLVNRHDFHMTLAFLGHQADDVVLTLRDVIATLNMPSMELSIDKIDCFEPNRVVWAGMTSPPTPLFSLQSELLVALHQNRIVWAAETGFTPHITLARKHKTTVRLLSSPLLWRPDTIALAESTGAKSGPKYKIITSKNIQEGSK